MTRLILLPTTLVLALVGLSRLAPSAEAPLIDERTAPVILTAPAGEQAPLDDVELDGFFE